MNCTNLDKWTHIEQCEHELLRGRKAQAANDAERMVGPVGRRQETAIPMAEPREPLTEREVDELTLLPPLQWCDHCVKGRGDENPHKRATLERTKSTLPASAFDFCFIRTSEACREWWWTKERRVLDWSMWTVDT